MYQRRSNLLGALPPVVRVLLITNIIVFVVNMITGGFINRLFAMYTPNTGYFQPYQFITHMFLHAGIGHIFMNMFGLFMFGPPLEAMFGSKKFFILYFASGLGAAGLQLALYILQGDMAGMVGASGAVFGVVAAFAVMFPDVELMLMFIPIPIKAKYFIPIYVGIELFSGVANFSFSNVAHFAHVGGAVVGFILIMIWKNNQFKNRFQ